MLVNNSARDRSGSNRHRNKNLVFFEHQFSWLLACTSIILKIDSSILLNHSGGVRRSIKLGTS